VFENVLHLSCQKKRFPRGRNRSLWGFFCLLRRPQTGINDTHIVYPSKSCSSRSRRRPPKWSIVTPPCVSSARATFHPKASAAISIVINMNSHKET
jgi:hypothetical protein